MRIKSESKLKLKLSQDGSNHKFNTQKPEDRKMKISLPLEDRKMKINLKIPINDSGQKMKISKDRIIEKSSPDYQNKTLKKQTPDIFEYD